jgi:hypothetical protein
MLLLQYLEGVFLLCWGIFTIFGNYLILFNLLCLLSLLDPSIIAIITFIIKPLFSQK